MASGGKEHRMLFDIRGKRRGVVKVVYAVLAVLMGLSLFLVTGASSLTGLFGGNEGGSAAAGFEEQVERIEVRLTKEPEDPNLLLALTKAQINVSNQLVDVNESEGQAFVESTPESRSEMQRASDSWSKYLKATDEPSVGGAKIVAPALYNFALNDSTSLTEAELNMKAAAEAQQIVTDQQPNLNSWSSLAFYRYLSLEFAAAEKAGEEAKKLTTSKFERENLENQLEEFSQAGRGLQRRIKAAEKASEGAGKGQLENPFGSLGGN